MRYVLIVILVAIQIVAGCPEWLIEEPFLERMICYSFFHASWWHLAVNCLSLWIIFDPKRRNNLASLICSYLIALVVYPIAMKPIIGISNLLYAAIGLNTPPLRSRWWRTPGVMVFLSVTVAMLFVRQVAGVTHIAAFVLAVIVSSIRRNLKRTLDDARRVKAL